MKSFKQYLAEAEQNFSQVNEIANMLAPVDSASPISGKNIDFSASEKLQRRKIVKKDEAIPNLSGKLSPAGPSSSGRTPQSARPS